jgi:flagellar motility protein MotE (MotC chaperone)
LDSKPTVQPLKLDSRDLLAERLANMPIAEAAALLARMDSSKLTALLRFS